MENDKMIAPPFTSVDIPVAAVGITRKTKFANSIVKDGKADIKALAKGFSYEP